MIKGLRVDVSVIAWRQVVVYGVLLAGTLGQVFGTVTQYVIPWGRRMWELRDRPALERSAEFAPWIGADVVDYFRFLRERIPENGDVILFHPEGVFSWWDNLQYHLFPRKISICDQPTLESCLAEDRAQPIFVLVLYGSPDLDQIPMEFEQIPFEGSAELGLIQVR